MKKLAALITIAIIVVVAWFLASPLFIDQTVDEALIIKPSLNAMPTRDEVLAMTPEMRDQTMQKITSAMANQADTVMDESMSANAQPTVLKTGVFKDADAVHKGSGDVLLYKLADNSYVLRLENFKVTNGPDLTVYLAKNADITEAAQVTEGFLNLGKLKGNIGSQNYLIPAGTDLSEYNSAVIWCELFGVLFSPATLSSTN